LSLHELYIPLVDIYLNKYQGCLDDKEFHKFCIAMIPKKKVNLKNDILLKPDRKNCKEQLKYIMDYFEVNENRAYEFYDMIGEELVDDIKRAHGIIE
jgi:hypothetical protein